MGFIGDLVGKIFHRDLTTVDGNVALMAREVKVFSGSLPVCHKKRDAVMGNWEVPRADTGANVCHAPADHLNNCRNQAHEQASKGQSIKVSEPSNGVIQFEHVPAGCLDLVVVLAGDCDTHQPPAGCGPGCVQYKDLNPAHLQQLCKYL